METGDHGLAFLFALNLAVVEHNRDLESVTVLLKLLVVLLVLVILLKIRNVIHKIVQVTFNTFFCIILASIFCAMFH